MEKHNVMVIDDSPVDRLLMKKILESSSTNLQVIESENADDIINILILKKIKVIILDLVLINKSGLEVLEKIQNNEQTRYIPVIIFSSITEPIIIKKALSLGAYDYFEKPLSTNDINFALELKVKNALELKLKLDRIVYLNNHDTLTDLYTRSYLEVMIANLEDGDLPIGLIIFDINGLKVINDAFGYETGQNIILEISEKLKKYANECDCVSRWGGDEFAILCSGKEGNHLNNYVDRIMKDINNTELIDFEVAYGVDIVTKEKSDITKLIQNAENNLYKNKVMETSSFRNNLIKTINNTLHQKNPREKLHSDRVSEVCESIAIELKLSSYEIKMIKLAGLMHDIGKITIDESILNKSGALNDKEWENIKKHPEAGYSILSVSMDTLEIAKAVLGHHEKWNGKGYPLGLIGEEIPFISRIIAVADAFDAMTGYRTYKDSMSTKVAVDEIIRCSGSHFDPFVVEAFLKINEIY